MKVKIFEEIFGTNLERKINDFLDENKLKDVDIKITYSEHTSKIVALIQYRDPSEAGAKL